MRACKALCWVAVGMVAFGAASVQAEVDFFMVPLAADGAAGTWAVVGDTITLTEPDQTVEVEVFVANWRLDAEDGTAGAKGFQTTLDCAGYISGTAGELTAINTVFGDFAYTPFQMGIDKVRADYIYKAFPGDFGGCSIANACINGPGGSVIGRHACLSASGQDGPVDPGAGESYYVGTYSFYVPADARGTFTVGLSTDPNDTSLRSSLTVAPILPQTIHPVTITIATGMCCNDPTGTLFCSNVKLLSECDAVGGVWLEGQTCSGVDANSDGKDDGCGCGSNADCGDADACTINVCDIAPGDSLGECDAPVNVVVGADECCAGATAKGSLADTNGLGAIANNVDGDQCTDDLCDDPGSCVFGDQCGAPTNPPSADTTACDDAYDCSTNDLCDGAGACAGTDINTISCTDDSMCVFPETPTGECDEAEGHCVCSLSTPLTLVVDDEDCCFEEGAVFDVAVFKDAGTSIVTGGQFLITWDPACVEFVGWDTVAEYPLVLFDELSAGQLFIAVGIQPFTGTGTNLAVTMANLQFKKLGGCTTCEICFADANPRHTILVDDEGLAVLLEESCSCEITQAGEAVLTVPAGEFAHSDCMGATAMVSWDEVPMASDSCEGPVDPVCYVVGHEPLWKCTVTHRLCGENNIENPTCGAGEGVCVEEAPMTMAYMEGLIDGGGEFAQGKTTFCCGADYSCDQTELECWTVQVSDKNAMDVIVELSPTMTAGQLTRCIEFGFYWDCVRDATIWRENLVFGPPFDFAGKSTPILLVQKGQYICLTAKDPLHTLRSVSDITCNEDGMLEAAFHYDPLFDGNWLIGGNLNGDRNIDILDFGAFLTQYLDVVPADTLCDGDYGMYHADINGDGMVDDLDFTFIAMNYLSSDKDSCCEGSTASVKTPPITSISVKDLRAMGLDHMAVADLNADGVLDTADMQQFLGGEKTRTKRDGRSIR